MNEHALYFISCNFSMQLRLYKTINIEPQPFTLSITHFMDSISAYGCEMKLASVLT